MSKLVDPRALRIRRDITKIFSLIKAHAIIHQCSRKKDSDGFILASIRDYSAVYKLVSDTISSEVEASVPKTVRETVNAVENIISGNSESVTLAELAEVMKIHKSTVQRRVARAIEQGYLINEEEKQGRPAKLIIGERMPDNIRILPTSKKLKQEYLKGKNLSKHSGD